jgi:hypothetical protein
MECSGTRCSVGGYAVDPSSSLPVVMSSNRLEGRFLSAVCLANWNVQSCKMRLCGPACYCFVVKKEDNAAASPVRDFTTGNGCRPSPGRSPPFCRHHSPVVFAQIPPHRSLCSSASAPIKVAPLGIGTTSKWFLPNGHICASPPRNLRTSDRHHLKSHSTGVSFRASVLTRASDSRKLDSGPRGLGSATHRTDFPRQCPPANLLRRLTGTASS